MQDQPDGSSMRNVFEDSCTKEVTETWKTIYEGGFKLLVSEARNKFDSTALAVQREEDRSASPYTQENKLMEGKLKHRVNEA